MNSDTRQTLFADTPGSTLSLEHNHLLCSDKDSEPLKLPLSYLNGIVINKFCSISTPLLHACLANNIAVTFVDCGGQLLGRVEPATPARLAIRAAQYKVAEKDYARLALARMIVNDKIRSQRKLILAYRGNYPGLNLKNTLAALQDAIRRVPTASSLATLRGLEGAAAAAYWRALPTIFRVPCSFQQRERRPPTDPVNSCLSFGYTLLVNTMAAAIENAGLDSRLAIIHGSSLRKSPLAWDLIEPFRVPCVDRIVIAGFNNRRYREDGFGPSGPYPCCLKPDTKRLFINDFFSQFNQPANKQRFLRTTLVNYVQTFIRQLLALAAPTTEQSDYGSNQTADADQYAESTPGGQAALARTTHQEPTP